MKKLEGDWSQTPAKGATLAPFGFLATRIVIVKMWFKFFPPRTNGVTDISTALEADFVQPPTTSPTLDQNALFNVLFLNFLILCFSLTTKDAGSCRKITSTLKMESVCSYKYASSYNTENQHQHIDRREHLVLGYYALSNVLIRHNHECKVAKYLWKSFKIFQHTSRCNIHLPGLTDETHKNNQKSRKAVGNRTEYLQILSAWCLHYSSLPSDAGFVQAHSHPEQSFSFTTEWGHRANES